MGARDAFHGWVKGPLLILHIGPLENCLDADRGSLHALERGQDRNTRGDEGSTGMHVRSGSAEPVQMSKAVLRRGLRACCLRSLLRYVRGGGQGAANDFVLLVQENGVLWPAVRGTNDVILQASTREGRRPPHQPASRTHLQDCISI